MVHARARHPAPPMQCWPACAECRCMDEILPVNIAGGARRGLGAEPGATDAADGALSRCFQLAEFLPPTVLGAQSDWGHEECCARRRQTALHARRQLCASRRAPCTGGGLCRLFVSLAEAGTGARLLSPSFDTGPGHIRSPNGPYRHVHGPHTTVPSGLYAHADGLRVCRDR